MGVRCAPAHSWTPESIAWTTGLFSFSAAAMSTNASAVPRTRTAPSRERRREEGTRARARAGRTTAPNGRVPGAIARGGRPRTGCRARNGGKSAIRHPPEGEERRDEAQQGDHGGLTSQTPYRRARPSVRSRARTVIHLFHRRGRRRGPTSLLMARKTSRGFSLPAVPFDAGRSRRGPRARRRRLRLLLREGLLLPGQRPRDVRQLPRDGRALRRLAGRAAPPGRHLQRLPHAGRPRLEVHGQGPQRLAPLPGVHARRLSRTSSGRARRARRSSRRTAAAATPTSSTRWPTAATSPASAATPRSATSADRPIHRHPEGAPHVRREPGPPEEARAPRRPRRRRLRPRGARRRRPARQHRRAQAGGEERRSSSSSR